MIDRDEVRFSAEVLQKLKHDHEASRCIGSGEGESDGDIIAIGPEIVAVGQVTASGPSGMRVRIAHFVEGSARDLLAFAHTVDRRPFETRYVLMNELGYGGPPGWRANRRAGRSGLRNAVLLGAGHRTT